MKKLIGVLLILFVITVSLLIIILPTFFSQDKMRIELKQEFTLEHILDAKEDIEFVFFGYVGCSDVCTPRLESFSSWYRNLDPNLKDKCTLRFVNLSHLEDPDLADLFIKTFNKNFKALYLKPNKLRAYTKPFSVYFSKSLSDNYEIDHTAHLYLVKKDKNVKSIRYIYSRYPYDFETISKDLKGLINE